MARGGALTLLWRQPPQYAHELEQLLLLAFSLPWAYPSLSHPATQCFEHYHIYHSHHCFMFLVLLIAPSFAFCAQLEGEISSVGVRIEGAG